MKPRCVCGPVLAKESAASGPPSIDAEMRLAVVALRSSKPADGTRRWSTRKLAKETDIGPTSVHRLLKEGRSKPHRTHYWCVRSPDPEFEGRQAGLLGLYVASAA